MLPHGSSPSNEEMALEAYIAHTGRADEAIKTLQLFIDDHGEVAPDDVDWGHVANMAEIADQIEALINFYHSGK